MQLLDTAAVSVLEISQMTELASRVAEVVIRFDVESIAPLAASQPTIEQAAAMMRSYRELAERVGTSPGFYITGHSNNFGAAELNRALELQRAESVAALLTASGVPADWLTTRGQLEAEVSGLREPAVSFAIRD